MAANWQSWATPFSTTNSFVTNRWVDAYSTGTASSTSQFIPFPQTSIRRDLQIESYYDDSTIAAAFTTPQTFRWDFGRLGFSGLSELGEFKNALMKIFEKVPEKLIKNDKDKQLVKAKEKSEKLLKEWLSPDEYNGLVLQGEIEMPSKIDNDTIFIIKRDPNQMVEVKQAGKYTHRLCLVSKDGDFPVGDQLLSKIALLKTDEKKFREIAIRHG